MIRSELVDKLSEKHRDLSARDIDNIVSAFFDAISTTLIQNGRVEIRGFGTFSTRDRDARTGRNPRTGEVVAIQKKRVPHFKCGKSLTEHINA